ncbi:MAG: FAD-binding protein [Chloroflexi bacterium]|nr:FAD-binding protein [Chloroflexota bacterium]
MEVVIVGAGTAGLPAAIAAADGGAHVVLIDKQTRVGGMLHVSTGQFSGAGTRLQRQRGIQDSPECHLADVERLSHGLANPELLRASVARQGGTVDWLEALGFDFVPDSPRLIFGHELYGVPRTFQGRQDGRDGRRLAGGRRRRRRHHELADVSADDEPDSGSGPTRIHAGVLRRPSVARPGVSPAA